MLVLNLRKVQTKDTSIFALKMEKSGLGAAAKPLGSPFLLENAGFLLKKHEIAAFVLVDKSGYFYGTADGIRTHDLQSRSLALYPAELQPHISINARRR